MKSLRDFILEYQVNTDKAEAIAKKILEKDKKLLKELEDESSHCPDDDFEEWQDNIVNNIEDYPARWKFLQAIAKELKIKPYDLLDEIDWHVLFKV